MLNQASMEKLLNPDDKEFMKMAMLKHEETFKEQVYELHRLYRIQKLLMNNIESSRSNGQLSSTKNPSMKLDLEQPADKYMVESNGDGMLRIMDEIEIELTLGPTNYYTRRRRKKPEMTRTSSTSGASFCSSSPGSSRINRTNISAKQVLTGTQLGLVQVSDSIKSEELLRKQERLDQQPSWLLQVLSLNIT